MNGILLIFFWGLYYMILSLLRYLYRRYVKSKKKKEDKKEDSDWHSYFLFRLRLGFAGVLACLTVYGL